MGQASLDALKVAETITLTGSDLPAFGKVVVTAGVEKLGQVSGASAASAGSGSATGGKQASFTATMADSSTASGVIGNPGINSIGVTTNPVGGAAVTGVAKTSAGGESSRSIWTVKNIANRREHQQRQQQHQVQQSQPIHQQRSPQLRLRASLQRLVLVLLIDAPYLLGHWP
jgi:hypothetical protein